MPQIPLFHRPDRVSGLCLFFAAISSGVAQGQTLDLVGEIIGTTGVESIDDQREVVWVDDYVFTGGAKTAEGGGLAIWDVSDPTAPVLVGEEGTGLKFARGVTVRDGIAYVTGRDSASVASISVSAPTQPQNLSVLHDPCLLGARGIALLDQFAIVACGLHPSSDKGTQGIAVIDLSDPSQLNLVARLDEKSDASGTAFCLCQDPLRRASWLWTRAIRMPCFKSARSGILIWREHGATPLSPIRACSSFPPAARVDPF